LRAYLKAILSHLAPRDMRSCAYVCSPSTNQNRKPVLLCCCLVFACGPLCTPIVRQGVFGLVLTATLALSTQIASAQPDRDKAASDDLFQAGLTEMLEGRHAAGCPKLAESYRLFPRPGTLFTLADCEAAWGHPAAALRHYDSYLEMFSQMPPVEQQAQRDKGREKK